jgi:hypothetical protein
MRRTASVISSPLVSSSLVPLLLALSASCGDVAPPPYGGESLLTFKGVLVSQVAKPLPEVDIVIGWPDTSKGEATWAPITTFVRLPIEATLPARFSASILEPPPATAFQAQTPPATFPRLVGPRMTMATILLARKGLEVTTAGGPALDFALLDPNEPVLATLDDYALTYVETDGDLAVESADGTTVTIAHLTAGYHLARQDRSECASSYDETCIAANVALGLPPDIAWQGCGEIVQTIDAVDVPAGTEIALTLKDPNLPRQRPPLCGTSSGG